MVTAALHAAAVPAGILFTLWVLEHTTPGSRDMQCFQDGVHLEHTWVYGGTEMFCDGMIPGPPDPPGGTPEGRCCADRLCACSPRPAGWSTHRAHGMNGEG